MGDLKAVCCVTGTAHMMGGIVNNVAVGAMGDAQVCRSACVCDRFWFCLELFAGEGFVECC